MGLRMEWYSNACPYRKESTGTPLGELRGCETQDSGAVMSEMHHGVLA